jgi:hypothetical protein
MPLDSVAKRSKRRRLPGVDVPVTQEDEVRRSLEALREHIRMYEGDSNAPKERFVTIEELELAGLIGTKVQGNFALIDSVLGNAVSKGQNDGSSSTIVGGGGVNTLAELLDTQVEGARPGAMLSYIDGFWVDYQLFDDDNVWTGRQDFYGCIRIAGTTDNYVQICHDQTDMNITGLGTTAINLVELPWNMNADYPIMWDDTGYLALEGTTPGGAPDNDPDIGNVILLLTAGGYAINRSGGSGFWNIGAAQVLNVGLVDILTPGYVDASLYYVQVRSTPDQRAISSDQSKFSDRSFWLDGDTGLTHSYMEIRPSSGIRTSMDALTGWNLSNQPFTMEAHVYLPNPGGASSDFPLLTVWNQTGVSDMFRWEFLWNNILQRWEHRFAFSTNGSNQISIFSQDGTLCTPDVWHHVAITRDSSNDFRVFVDGVLDAGPVNNANAIVAPNSEHWLQFMTWDDDVGNVTGYCDNIRVTQGVARYTSNFTAPTKPYQGSNSTQAFVVGDVGVPTTLDGEDVTVLNDFIVDGNAFFNIDATVTGVMTATTAVVGDPGDEAASILVNDATWESQLFVSNIGGAGESMLTLHQHHDTQAPVFLGVRSKALTTAHTVVADNDQLLRIIAGGWDGSTTYSQAAEIRFNVDGTPGNNDMPGEISFLTSADGTQTPLERVRIRADGAVEVVGPTGSGYSSTSHDDTDLTTLFTNTTDWNIDSLTAMNFGTDVVLEWNDVEYISQGLSGPGDPYFNDLGLLLHFNGTDGATTTTDSSSYNATVSFFGNAQLDNAQVKFGSTSLLLDGTGDYLQVPVNDDLRIDLAGDYTVECWFRLNATGVAQTIMNRGGINGVAWPNWTFGVNSSDFPYFFVYANGGANANRVSTNTVTSGQWYHMAATWNATTRTVEIFIDGVSQGTGTNGSLTPYSGNNNALSIGHQPSDTTYFNGWLDDIRCTYGVRRYTAGFTAPTAEFPDVQQGTSFVLGNLTNRSLVQGTNVDIVGDVTADDTLTSVAGVWTFAQTATAAVFNIAGSLDNDPALGGNQDAQFNFMNASGTEIGDMAWTSGPSLRLRNLVHDGNVIIAGQDSGGLDRNMIVADPSTGVELYFDTNLSARTVSSANGGLQADNTATGAGLERVLTTSDLVTGIADGTVNNSLLRWDTTAVAWEEESSWLLSDTGVLTLDEGSFGKTVTFSHDGFDYNIVPGINTRDIIFGDTTGDGDFTAMRIHNCNVIISDSSPSMGVNIGSRTASGSNICEFTAFGTAGVLTGVDWYFNTEGNTNWFRVTNSTAITGNNTLEFGTDNTAEIMRYVGRSGGTDPYYFDIKLIEDVATSGDVAMRIKNNNTEFARFDIGTGTNFFRLSGTGTEFRHESGTAGWDRYFSGALAITDFANVTDWRIQGLTGDVEIMDGRGLTCVSSGGSNAVAIRHDGTDVNWTHAITTDWNISGITNVRLNDVGLAIGNAGETADVVFAHDGSDLNITETGTGAIVFPAAGTLGLTMTDNDILQPILKDWAQTSTSPTVATNAVTLDYTAGNAFEVDLEPATATVTVTISGGPPSGTHGRIIAKFQQDGATAQTLSWAGGTFRWEGGTAHPMNSTLDGISIYTLDTWDGGTTWYGKGADYS